MIEVRLARLDDVDALTDVRALAFYDDPADRWLFPDDQTRLDSLRRTAHHGLLRSVPQGRVWCTTDRLGIAMWRRPDEPPAGQLRSLLGQVRMARLLLRVGPPLRTALSADGLLRQHLPEDPHWILGSIATHPDARRAGRATALITSGLAECDRMGMPCFLSTSSPGNIPFYERFGFRVVGEIDLPANGPRETMMRRERTPSR